MPSWRSKHESEKVGAATAAGSAGTNQTGARRPASIGEAGASLRCPACSASPIWPKPAEPDGQNDQAYSLADAMHDAICCKNTAAWLKSLTTSQSACAEGRTKKTPSIGVVA